MEVRAVGQEYDEISLIELIETLIKGRKIIAVITIICVFVTGIFSFFIIKPQYEARALLMANFATEKLASINSSTENIEDLLNLTSTLPSLTLQTYKEQLNNPEILRQTMEELNIKNLKIEQLANMISLEIVEGTNLIAIKVKNTDPEIAAQIANTISDKFGGFINKLFQNHALSSYEFIEEQMDIEKRNLEAATKELKDFLSQTQSVEQLEKQIESKLEELNMYKNELSVSEVDYQKQLMDNKSREEVTIANINQLNELLKNTPEKLVTEKSLAQDSLLSEGVKENSDLELSELADIKMTEEQINPNYLELENKINEYKVNLSEIRQEKENIQYKYSMTTKILTDKISSNTKEIEFLYGDITEKRQKQNLIESKVTMAQETYNLLLKKYEDLRITESSNIVNSNLTVISYSEVPKIPVSPNKMLNILISGVIGVMISGFIVFFKEYWGKYKKSEDEKSDVTYSG
jgi:capsular polysaccharide biosynthesis protein